MANPRRQPHSSPGTLPGNWIVGQSPTTRAQLCSCRRTGTVGGYAALAVAAMMLLFGCGGSDSRTAPTTTVRATSTAAASATPSSAATSTGTTMPTFSPTVASQSATRTAAFTATNTYTATPSPTLTA